MSASTHSTSGASAASTGSISPRPNAPYSSWICSRLDTWGTLSPRCRFSATRNSADRLRRRSCSHGEAALSIGRPRKDASAGTTRRRTAKCMPGRWLRRIGTEAAVRCNGGMDVRKVTAMMSIAVALAVAPTLVARGEDASDRTPPPQAPSERPKGAVENCSTRSMADFPGAYSDPHNVVVGPLVLVGAAHTPARTVREYGGNKFPLLVRAGRRVTVALSRATRRVAGLGYGPLPQGWTWLRATAIAS